MLQDLSLKGGSHLDGQEIPCSYGRQRFKMPTVGHNSELLRLF